MRESAGIDDQAPAETWDRAMLNVTKVLFEPEWLRIGTIDHRQPLATTGKVDARGRRGSGSICIHAGGGWMRMVISRCGPEASGRPVTIFETLGSELHLAKALAHPPAFVKRPNLSR